MTTVKESIEMINDFGNKGFESVRQLAELNQRTLETLMGRQMDAVNLFMESSVRHMEMLSAAKGYNDLVKGEVELAKDLGERLIEESRENVKLAGAAREEYRAWYEQGVANVSEKLASFQPSV